MSEGKGRKAKVVIVLLAILAVAGIVGYYAVGGGWNPVDTVLSLIMGGGRVDDSEARKAGRELEVAEKEGSFPSADKAFVGVLRSCADIIESDPSNTRCAELTKSAAEKFGMAHINGAMRFLPEGKVVEIRDPVVAQVAALAPVNQGGIPVHQVSPETFAKLERAVKANGGTVTFETDPLPLPTLPAEQVQPSPRFDAPATQFAEVSNPTLLTGKARWRRVEELNRVEKAGRLAPPERAELAGYRAEWRESRQRVASR